MGSNSGKYLIPFGIFIVVLNIGLITVLLLQNILMPPVPETTINEDELLSIPTSSPVSFP